LISQRVKALPAVSTDTMGEGCLLWLIGDGNPRSLFTFLTIWRERVEVSSYS
jgi:hypothetical protein